jgi:hypothetical protein
LANSGEQGVLYYLNLGEFFTPNQPQSNGHRKPIIGFAAGTPIRTAGGSKPIEDLCWRRIKSAAPRRAKV